MIQYFVLLWMEIRFASTVAIGPIVSAMSAMFLKLVNYKSFPASLFVGYNYLSMGRTNLETEGCPNRCFTSV